MPCNKVLILFANLCVLVFGSPQEYGGPTTQEPTGGLPFLQFTNGGVRVNFAGFHAEAGLGGLLGGNNAGGGLHASAGTPWGANAAAGLGGLLGGDNGNAGGGLYARAGLGNGLPEAGAGLGGMLDGSGRSAPARGGLFAGATTGNWGRAVGIGSVPEIPGESGSISSSVAGSSSAGTSSDNERRSTGRTHIQIVPKGGFKKQNEVKAAAVTSSAETPEKSASTNKEVKQETVRQVVPGPSASASLFGAITADGPILSKSVQKVKILDGQVDVKRTDLAHPPPPAPVSIAPPAIIHQAEIDVTPGSRAHSGATIDNNVYTIEKRPVRPRWYYRKRVRAGLPKKQVIVTGIQGASNAPVAPNVETVPIVPAVPPASDITAAASGTVYKTYNKGTLFDDIFNIPISTLNAVNQLLRNNAG